MRRIGDDAAGHAAIRLSAQGNAPGDGTAPVVTDNRETPHAQRVGEQEDIADQLVGRIGLNLLRLGRIAIAALVRRDAAKTVGEMCDLVSPGAVAFGKAVQEHQRRRIARADVHHVELDVVCQFYTLLFHHHPSVFIFSI